MRAILAVLVLAVITQPPLATADNMKPWTTGPGALDMARALDAGTITSEALVREALARIKRIDQAGPRLNAVLALNPEALAAARALDAERKGGHVRSPLHGVPILIKDNIETLDPLPTTAGSLGLARNFTYRDAPLVARLRAAGLVILGKTNLSEWANIRSTHSTSGWSAIGGLVKNPHVLDRSACGSSSGSGAAIAAGLAPLAIGTETDGSIVCPSSANGIVGLKPTLGLISRTHVVPIAHSQDSAGPMTRNVADTAALLTVLAGSDPADPATAQADQRKQNYVAALDGATLKGKRLGVLRYATGRHEGTDKVFTAALAAMRQAGAEIVDLNDFKLPATMGEQEFLVLTTELKADLDAYLTSTPSSVGARDLDAQIAFHKASPREMALFGLEIFEAAAKTKGLDDPAYREALAKGRRASREDGIDKLIAEHRLDALVAPTMGPSWRVDVALGDRGSGGVARIAAVAGYPHLTVPMGFDHGLPLGISFIGEAWSDARLLALGAAFEALTQARRDPIFAASSEALEPNNLAPWPGKP